MIVLSFQTVRFYVKSWLPARSIVMECLAARYDIHPSGEIMVLKQFCPVSMHSPYKDCFIFCSSMTSLKNALYLNLMLLLCITFITFFLHFAAIKLYLCCTYCLLCRIEKVCVRVN